MSVYNSISVTSEILVQPVCACVLLQQITLGLALEPQLLLECVIACTNNVKYLHSKSKITEICYYVLLHTCT